MRRWQEMRVFLGDGGYQSLVFPRPQLLTICFIFDRSILRINSLGSIICQVRVFACPTDGSRISSCCNQSNKNVHLSISVKY